MNYRRGDIVLADLPFTDRTGSKMRPAVVVQSDRNNQRLDDIVLVLITRTTHRAVTESTQLLIDITTPEGKQSGLLHTSAVKCEHIITLHKMFLQRIVGHLSATQMVQLNDCIKTALDLR